MRLTKMYLYKLLRSAGLWSCMLLTCMLVVMPGLLRLFFRICSGLPACIPQQVHCFRL